MNARHFPMLAEYVAGWTFVPENVDVKRVTTWSVLEARSVLHMHQKNKIRVAENYSNDSENTYLYI